MFQDIGFRFVASSLLLLQYLRTSRIFLSFRVVIWPCLFDNCGVHLVSNAFILYKFDIMSEPSFGMSIIIKLLIFMLFSGNLTSHSQILYGRIFSINDYSALWLVMIPSFQCAPWFTFLVPWEERKISFCNYVSSPSVHQSILCRILDIEELLQN